MDKQALSEWCNLPTKMGIFRMYDTKDENIRLVSFGNIEEFDDTPLVRIHSSCMASEIFNALDCDCSDQLNEAMELLAKEQQGIIFHLHQEGRGQGLSNKIKAIQLMQQNCVDTVEAFDCLNLKHDIRDYKKATDLLNIIGINKIRLITNNPRKVEYVESQGISVVEIVNTNPIIRKENRDYLYSKKIKLSHQLTFI